MTEDDLKALKAELGRLHKQARDDFNTWADGYDMGQVDAYETVMDFLTEVEFRERGWA